MKVSVIVPVFKVEQYLYRCINSILNQTYQDIEIILVDDGSPDSCPAMCDELAMKYKNIVVIHQNNAGLAGARNTGLEHATGDYVGFVDSDDWIETDTYAHCMTIIEKYQADIFQYQLGYVYDEGTKLNQHDERLEIYKGKDILQQYMYSTTTGKGGDYSVCVCLFKKSLLNGVRFRTGKINEDIDFKYKVFSVAIIMINTNLKKYHYFQQKESISLGGLCKKDFDLYDAADAIMDLSKSETYGVIRKLVEVKKARTPLSLLCKIAYFGVADPSIDKSKTVSKLVRELRSNLWTLWNSPLPLSRRILALLFSTNYWLTETLIHIVKKL